MGRLRKPLEGRSEAHVGFRPRSMRSLAATSRNPFLLDFRGGFLKKSGHEARFLLAAPGAGSHNLTADSHSRKGVRRAPGRSCAFNSQGAAFSPAAGAASRRLNEVEKRRLHRLFKPFNLHRLPSPCGLPRLHGPFGPPQSFGLLGQRRLFGLRGLPGSGAPIA